MSNQSDLLHAYELWLRTEEAIKDLAPERLRTMKADSLWIQAVSAHTAAQRAFMKTALDFCRTIRPEQPALFEGAAQGLFPARHPKSP
jgi:hypothetical protein